MQMCLWIVGRCEMIDSRRKRNCFVEILYWRIGNSTFAHLNFVLSVSRDPVNVERPLKNISLFDVALYQVQGYKSLTYEYVSWVFSYLFHF